MKLDIYKALHLFKPIGEKQGTLFLIIEMNTIIPFQ